MDASPHPTLAGSAMDAAELLIAESARRWKWAEGDYRDDITAIVVFLPCFGEPDTTSRCGLTLTRTTIPTRNPNPNPNSTPTLTPIPNP